MSYGYEPYKNHQKIVTYSMKIVAHRLGVSSNRRLLKGLRDLGIVVYNYEENVPNKEYIELGYFLIDIVYTNYSKVRVIKVTEEGVAFISKLIGDNPVLFGF